jgi:hypothetical protein
LSALESVFWQIDGECNDGKWLDLFLQLRLPMRCILVQFFRP